jgi:hypothetical protein
MKKEVIVHFSDNYDNKIEVVKFTDNRKMNRFYNNNKYSIGKSILWSYVGTDIQETYFFTYKYKTHAKEAINLLKAVI